MNNQEAKEIVQTFREAMDHPETQYKDVLLGALDMAIEALDRDPIKFNIDELCRMRSDLKSGLYVGSALRTQKQVNRYIKALDEVIEAGTRGGEENETSKPI